jgi:hypothetical protein
MDPGVPAVIVIPVAALAMLVIAAHVVALQRSSVPPTRRRIRTACGVLMLFLAALLAHALTMGPAAPHPVLAPAQTRAFLLIWLVIISLVLMVVILAAADAAYSTAVAYSTRRRLRRDLARELGEHLAARAAPAPGNSDSAGTAGESARG